MKAKMEELCFKMFILLECNHFNGLEEVPTRERSHSSASRVLHLMGHINMIREDLKGGGKEKSLLTAQIPYHSS